MLQRLLTRVGARAGVAIVLVLLVLGVLVVTRLTGGPTQHDVLSPGEQSLPTTVDPSVGDDGEVAPTLSAGPQDAAIIAAVQTFFATWLRRDLTPKEWHNRLSPLCTASLSASLDGVDPKTVPANRTLSSPEIVLRTEQYAQAKTTVDAGTITLNLANQTGRWLIDTIDWDRT